MPEKVVAHISFMGNIQVGEHFKVVDIGNNISTSYICTNVDKNGNIYGTKL